MASSSGCSGFLFSSSAFFPFFSGTAFFAEKPNCRLLFSSLSLRSSLADVGSGRDSTVVPASYRQVRILPPDDSLLLKRARGERGLPRFVEPSIPVHPACATFVEQANNPLKGAARSLLSHPTATNERQAVRLAIKNKKPVGLASRSSTTKGGGKYRLPGKPRNWTPTQQAFRQLG